MREGAAGPVSVPGADGSYWQVVNVNGQLAITKQGANAPVSESGSATAAGAIGGVAAQLENVRRGANIPITATDNASATIDRVLGKIRTADAYGGLAVAMSLIEAHGGVVDYFANGGVRYFAGGAEDHVAQIAPAGAWRVWAEPETGGEAYVPLAHGKRARSEAIMGVVPKAKAGVGSAVNDATRELGGTLGVAVIGSVALSLYRDTIGSAQIPPAAEGPAKESVGGALEAARRVAEAGQTEAAMKLSALAKDGFLDGMAAGCLVAAGVSLVGALVTIAFLPAHPGATGEDGATGTSTAA